MTLANLVGKTRDRVPPDKDAIQRLITAAGGSIQNAKLKGMNEEGQFDMAYKAIMQLATRRCRRTATEFAQASQAIIN